jgi:glucose/arabinose dehydrogenase
MLYVGMGDGGSGGDPQGNGQNLNTLLGALLRFDVDGVAPYAIPSDNPYVDGGGRPEIWASGLRNPWRFSFDRQNGDLYIADVGQNRLEEINVRPSNEAGVNYGWNTMEGSECFGSGGCDPSAFTLHVLEYDHADGCSVTGGYVYRGDRVPELTGHYFYADYCEGWIRSFKYLDGVATDQTEWELPDVGQITSFGQDAHGELYVLSATGDVYRIDTA